MVWRCVDAIVVKVKELVEKLCHSPQWGSTVRTQANRPRGRFASTNHTYFHITQPGNSAVTQAIVPLHLLYLRIYLPRYRYSKKWRKCRSCIHLDLDTLNVQHRVSQRILKAFVFRIAWRLNTQARKGSLNLYFRFHAEQKTNYCFFVNFRLFRSRRNEFAWVSGRMRCVAWAPVPRTQFRRRLHRSVASTLSAAVRTAALASPPPSKWCQRLKRWRWAPASLKCARSWCQPARQQRLLHHRR